jgi:putative DNA methylase
VVNQKKPVSNSSVTISALEDGFPLATISRIAEAESWRKEIYRPIYHLHKWWAQRLGSVFRAVILGVANPKGANILDKFYASNDLAGFVVYDPFMGSGTTVGEAVKLGCTAIGRDINPVAYNAVRAALAPVSSQKVLETYKWIQNNVAERILSLYRLNDGRTVLYYFWVKEVDCQKCQASVPLFSKYIFGRHAYPEKNPTAQCLCPTCGGIFQIRYDATHANCPSCSASFNPQEGPASRAHFTCKNCGHSDHILKCINATQMPPRHRMYAKLVLGKNGEKNYERIDDNDSQQFEDTVQSLKARRPFLDDTELMPGHNTNQAINYGYTRWSQFFNERQLLALSLLAEAISEVKDSDIRFLFSILFSGILEFNNMFCSHKGEGTGAVRHMFAHHILKPERQPLEANVWGTPKSSGAFSTLFQSRIIRALAYKQDPFEVYVVNHADRRSRTEKILGINRPIDNTLDIALEPHALRRGGVYLSCGDSSSTDIPSKSVDAVITDPPFFDNVHYSELADFFFAWQRPLLGDARDVGNSTRHPGEVQDKDGSKFSS